MSSKIQILLSIVESFDRNKNHPTLTEKQLAVYIATDGHFKKQASDQEWYAKVASSFVRAINNGQNPHDWLAGQLKQLGIYQASNAFQGKHIQNYHCMSFLSDFLYGKQFKMYCNLEESFSKRMSLYISDSQAQPITEEKLKTGDLVVYRGINPNQKYDYIHVAIFIEKTNGALYAISKFGLAHNVFIHRTQDVLDGYRESSFYRSKFKLDSNTSAKFVAIKEELHSGLQQTAAQEIKLPQVAPPETQLPKAAAQETKLSIRKATYEGTKLHSGFVYLWPSISIKLASNKDGINEEGVCRERPNADPVFRVGKRKT